MNADDAKAIRRRLGLTEAQMGRVLRLKPANAFSTVRRMEAGQVEVSGPASLALEALDDGWRPHDFERNARRGPAK